MDLICEECTAPGATYNYITTRPTPFTHIPNPLSSARDKNEQIPEVARMRKACFGCATCEKFVQEPPLFNSTLSTLRSPSCLRTLLLCGVLYVCFTSSIVLVSGSSSASSPGSSSSSLQFSDCSITLSCILSLIRKYLMYFFLSLPPILYINTVRSQSTPKASFSSIPPPLQSLVTSPKVSSLVNTPSYKSKIAAVLSSAIQCKTISYDFSSSAESPQTDYTQLTKLHKLLATSFPMAHKLLKKEQVNKYSLVYTWEGTDKSLKPIMICSHLDVVPAPENNENASMNWTHPPFAGKVVDGEIWGRGAIDNKHNVVGQLAAVELLLEHDPSFAPQRTIIIAMGHDEEICGDQGAFFIEKHLFKTRKDLPKTNGFEAIFDEGPMMVEGAMPGFMGNAALIANAEKGAVTLELRVDTAGGHSSMPPIKEEGAVSIIAKAVTKLEANPFPAKFSRGSNMRKQLQFLSPMFSTPMRVVTSNLWLFSPLLKKVLLRASNGAAAMLRTTTAVTVIQGGDKYNVLPYTVKAYVNHRIHPEDTLEGVIEYDKKVIDDDRIKVTVVGGVTPASKVSSLTSNSFAWVKESVANVFNNPSTCSLMIGNTDTRHYWNLSNDIYRFSPVNLHVKELGMFHGLNERISVDNLAGVCLYYRELMLRAQQK